MINKMHLLATETHKNNLHIHSQVTNPVMYDYTYYDHCMLSLIREK